jgi:alkylation response protein AidB-like acyl-CoA dehydrogenase
MDFRWSPEHLAFRDEVAAFIQEWRSPELLREYREREGAAGPIIRGYYQALQDKGWMRMCWPKEMGGEGRDPIYRFIMIETMEYWGMPYGNLTYTSIAPALATHGSDDQKARFLPGIWSGEYTFAIGYSEPNAGSDLASLRTRAERVEGGWVIQGQKIWTSLAAQSTHIWLAARTDPDVPRHQGISLFIVPTDSEGVTVRPLQGMSGMVTYETFYDGVRVPEENLVGGEGGGWNIVMHALNHERVGLSPTGNLARNYDLLVDHLRSHAPEKLREPAVRTRLAELRMELAQHRALAGRNAVTIAEGDVSPGEASMAKISGSEVRARMTNTAMDLLGRAGSMTAESGELAAAEGRHQSTWLMSTILRFGGGANELQRSIIAGRHLGMAR